MIVGNLINLRKIQHCQHEQKKYCDIYLIIDDFQKKEPSQFDSIIVMSKYSLNMRTRPSCILSKEFYELKKLIKIILHFPVHDKETVFLAIVSAPAPAAL